jgi:hypothetical protein
MLLYGVRYHHVLGQQGWNTSYILLHGSSPAYAYSHLVIKSKFPMLPTTTRKGLPRFSMPIEVKENLITTIEKRRNYAELCVE